MSKRMSLLAQGTQHELSEGSWYTRREGVMRGPFSAENISHYILLGRIRLDDELSQDRETWVIAGQLTSLLPIELTSQSSWDDYQRLMIAHMEVDERMGERRCTKYKNYLDSHAEQRTSPDRRREDENSLLNYYLYAGAMSAGQKHSNARRLRPFLLTILLAALMLAWFNPAQH